MDAVHPEPRVDDGGRIVAHPARPDLVVVRDRRLPDVLPHVVGRAHGRSRVSLDRAPFAQRRGGADPPAELDGRDQALEIGLAGEDVRVERDGILGRSPCEPQGPPAERPHHPAEQREAVVGPLHPRLVHRHHEVDRLDVGRRQARSRAPEEVRLARRETRRRRADLALRAEDHR